MLQSVISKLKTGDVFHLNVVANLDRDNVLWRGFVCRIDSSQEGRCG